MYVCMVPCEVFPEQVPDAPWHRDQDTVLTENECINERMIISRDQK